MSRQVGSTGTYGPAHGYISGPGAFPQWADPAIIGGVTSSTVYLSAYSMYSSYQSLKFKLYGKYAANGAEVHLKIVLDDTAHNNIVDGTLTPTLSYLMPDALTQGGATFTVAPAPTVAITNNFNSGDDS